MSAGGPVEVVVAYLKERGFSLWPDKLIVRDVAFSFDAVLQGPEGFSDLVLVCDTLAHDNDEDIVRQVLGLARALDMARKTNPLTTVVVGRRPNLLLMNRMMSVSRVLALGLIDEAKPDVQLENGLAILSPLKFENASGSVADPMTELRSRLSDIRADLRALVDTADEGEDAVRKAINVALQDNLAPALEDYI